MKKSILIILALLSTSAIFGQRISIGSEAGFISSINTDYTITDFENRRNTYYSGLNVNYKYNHRLSFTSGIHYLRQGYRHSTCYIFEEGVKNQLTGKIDFLTLPLIANIHIGKSKRFVASVGLLGNYNIKAVQDYPEPIGGCLIGYPEDLTETTQNFGFGGIAGIGYKLFDNDNFEGIFMIKYYQGLSNTFKNPYSFDYDINKRYSSVLSTLTLNYKL
ncbi:MAG: PorT family protein [Bacteroidales bacterium]|nr:PorT family protein [Bacteroidales bacterium]